MAVAGLLGAGLASCASFVDKPVRPTLYDFGPVAASAAASVAADASSVASGAASGAAAAWGAASANGAPAAAAAAPAPGTAPLLLAEIEAAGALDGSAILYRLGYADANQLRPYAMARWTAPPPQLVRQRLREQLGVRRPVLNLGEAAALAREGGVTPRVLRIELEEFAHYFDAPAQSAGVVRLRATLLDNTSGGEKLVGQRSIAVQRPAATADAPGGVRALVAAVDEAAAQLNQWLAQMPAAAAAAGSAAVPAAAPAAATSGTAPAPAPLGGARLRPVPPRAASPAGLAPAR